MISLISIILGVIAVLVFIIQIQSSWVTLKNHHLKTQVQIQTNLPNLVHQVLHNEERAQDLGHELMRVKELKRADQLMENQRNKKVLKKNFPWRIIEKLNWGLLLP